MIPNFADVDLGPLPSAKYETDLPVWETPEGIAVKPVYGPSDVDGLDFLETYPGVAPFQARRLAC